MSQFAITRGDVFGGLTAGIVALPLCLAFGVASGLGAAAGLYGGIILGIVASLVGGTPAQISGPTAPMTLIAAGVVATNTLPTGQVNVSNVFAVFLVAGALQALFGVARLGRYVRFLPYPVISGLMTGIGIIIIIQQIFPVAGLDSPSSNPLVILRSLGTLQHGVHPGAVLLGAATVALAYLLPRVITAVPPSLIALVTLTIIAVVFGISAPTIGDIPGGLPHLIVPTFDFADPKLIITAAFQLAFLGSIDALTTSLVADNITRTHHDSNRELVGQGVGNMAAALFGGIPGAGAFMRTAINIRAGGRHRSSGVIHGLLLLAILLGLSGVVRYIPHAVLAGILISAGLSIIDYRSFAHFSTAPRADIALKVLVVLLTIFTDLITAVGIGMIAASLVFMASVAGIMEQRTSFTLVEDEPWADEIEIPEELRNRLLIKHLDGPLFFGFAQALRKLSSQVVGKKLLVLRMEQVSYMDQSGIYALQDVLVDLEFATLRVLLVGLQKSQIDRLEAMQVVPGLVPRENVFATFEEFRRALPAIIGKLG